MTALSIPAANVSLDSGPHDVDCVAGEAFSAGASVIRKDADALWYKAQCDGTVEEAGATDLGIALFTAAGAGSRGSVAKSGAVVSVGSAVCTAGFFYCPGRTAGSLVPSADLASPDKSTLAAVGISTSKLLVTRIYNAGMVIA